MKARHAGAGSAGGCAPGQAPAAAAGGRTAQCKEWRRADGLDGGAAIGLPAPRRVFGPRAGGAGRRAGRARALAAAP